MKRLVAIFVFLSLFVQSTIQLGILGYYRLNKDYIVRNLCENRNKPELNCCGKCFLRKQMKKTEENNTSKDLPVKIEKNEVLSYVLPSFVTDVFGSHHTTLSVKNPAQQHLHGYNFLLSVFHPPSFTS